MCKVVQDIKYLKESKVDFPNELNFQGNSKNMH